MAVLEEISFVSSFCSISCEEEKSAAFPDSLKSDEWVIHPLNMGYNDLKVIIISLRIWNVICLLKDTKIPRNTEIVRTFNIDIKLITARNLSRLYTLL